MKIVEPSASLLWVTPNPAQAIERAGRVCYKSEDQITPDSAARFVKMLIKRGHTAMLEHASASLLLVTDRGISHEQVRHRIASYAQESSRYCNYSKDKFDGEISVIKPPDLNEESFLAWEQSVDMAESAYMTMIRSGCKPEIARSVLPTCTKTELVVTCNLREWLHILDLRLLGKAGAPHPQMIQIMTLAREILARECPEVFGLFY